MHELQGDCSTLVRTHVCIKSPQIDAYVFALMNRGGNRRGSPWIWLARLPIHEDLSPIPYFKILTARAITRDTIATEMSDCSAIVSLAQRASGMTSVGLKAKALVSPR